MDELELAQRRRAVLDAELGERALELADPARVLVPELAPLRAIAERQARERRRQLRILHLERVAGDDPHPGAAACRDRRERNDVVLDHDVGRDLGEDLGEAVVDVTRAVDERLPRRLDELADLLEGALAEDGRSVADEVLPELARLLRLRRRRGEPHRPLLESLRLERACEGLLDDEHDPMATPAQDVTDADAVVRRAERALRKEDDRSAGGAQRPNGLKGFGLEGGSTTSPPMKSPYS